MFLLTEIGARLKEAREAKGYSLDDLQEITKIQKRYLAGIEEGNYDAMPGKFYIRAFIKQYAEAVDLNAEELLETYKNEVPGGATKDIEATTAIPAQSPQTRKRSHGPSRKTMEAMPKIIVGLFIVVIVGVIWYMVYQSKANHVNEAVEENPQEVDYKENPEASKKPAVDEEQEKADKEAAEKAAADKEAEEKAKAEEEATANQEITGQITNNVSNYTVTGADKLNLRVEVSGDAWLEVRDANTRASLVGDEGIRVYTAGEKIEVDATENKAVYLVVGNIQNAKIYVNDKEVEYLHQGYPQNIVITLADK